MLLLHALSDLVFIKFILYLHPVREEGPSSLAGIAAVKVDVYIFISYFVYVSVEVLFQM